MRLDRSTNVSRPAGARSLSLVVGLSGLFLLGSMNVPAQRRPTRPGAAPPAGATPAPQVDFDKLAAAATAAREADKIDEAIALYRQALSARPGWAEGWWFLGTIYYDVNRYADAVPAFKHVVDLQAKTGSPWVMLGL